MTMLKATIITGNLRDVDGCDSDDAIDSIVRATECAGDEFAARHGITVTVSRHVSSVERQSQTVVTWGHTEGEEPFDGTTDRLCEELSDHLNDAISRAIEAGDWED